MSGVWRKTHSAFAFIAVAEQDDFSLTPALGFRKNSNRLLRYRHYELRKKQSPADK
jgi:hypothetical protein